MNQHNSRSKILKIAIYGNTYDFIYMYKKTWLNIRIYI